LASFRKVLPLIRNHHERLDGTGYPDRLAGSSFPLLPRVLQTADIYDALTNPRPYKPAMPRVRALEIMEEEADKGWRDPEITARFVKLNKKVLRKIGDYSRNSSDTCMQDSLNNLEMFLAS
jgi:putative two-component system response regulator